MLSAKKKLQTAEIAVDSASDESTNITITGSLTADSDVSDKVSPPKKGSDEPNLLEEALDSWEKLTKKYPFLNKKRE